MLMVVAAEISRPPPPRATCVISGLPTQSNEGRQVNIIKHKSGMSLVESFIRGFQFDKCARGLDWRDEL